MLLISRKMNCIKNNIIFCLIFLCCSAVQAQESDTLQLSLEEAESLLLENNLALLAEELNIQKAEAEKIQAKVWPNPTLSIEEFNPYITDYQKRHAEEQASWFSEGFGKYRQVSVQLEQLIYLAGKRKKQQAIADVSIEKAELYLTDFLWNLKTEFRQQVYDFAYHSEIKKLLENELESLQKINKAYKKQQEKGNVGKNQFMRLKSSEMKLKNELIQTEKQLSQLQSELVVLLNLSNNTSLSFVDIFDAEYDYKNSLNHLLPELQEKALENRPDIQLSDLENDYLEKKLAYEKSLRTPDLELSVEYDRGGGIYPDYWSMGVAFDLPFFNANKGKIKRAEINVQQQEYYHDQNMVKAKADIRNKYEKLLQTVRFFEDIDAEYLKDLEKTMESYTRGFTEKSIGIVEFMDFLETYIDNMETIYDNQKAYFNAVEELKYAVGLEDVVQ